MRGFDVASKKLALQDSETFLFFWWVSPGFFGGLGGGCTPMGCKENYPSFYSDGGVLFADPFRGKICIIYLSEKKVCMFSFVVFWFFFFFFSFLFFFLFVFLFVGIFGLTFSF